MKKKVIKKKVAKKKAVKKDPFEEMLERAEAAQKAKEKENAPAQKIMKKLEKFCIKNNVKIFGTFALDDVDKYITRSINCPNELERHGLIKITKDEI